MKLGDVEAALPIEARFLEAAAPELSATGAWARTRCLVRCTGFIQ
jgi:hypothetical protein